jgi:hypothetical protein
MGNGGAVLAGTFAMLGTLPLVVFTGIDFAVAPGVLPDTILARPVLDDERRLADVRDAPVHGDVGPPEVQRDVGDPHIDVRLDHHAGAGSAAGLGPGERTAIHMGPYRDNLLNLEWRLDRPHP